MKNLPRVTYSNTGEDFSGVHAYLDQIIPEAEARLLGKVRPAFIDGRIVYKHQCKFKSRLRFRFRSS